MKEQSAITEVATYTTHKKPKTDIVCDVITRCVQAKIVAVENE
jgi:hypothetical protein